LIRDYTGKGWWGGETILDLFLKTAERTPDQTALVDPPNRSELTTGSPQRLTYAELGQLIDRLADSLAEMGLRKDDVVVVQLPNIVELVTVYLAAARIGAIVSPMPMQYRKHELRQVLALTEPKAFICAGSFGGFDFPQLIGEIRGEFPQLEVVIGVGEGLPDGVISFGELQLPRPAEASLEGYPGAEAKPVSANDVLTICWTSGTEAEPKGVPRSHNHWIWIAYATVDGCELDPGCSLLNPFPLINMAGIGGMLVPWLLTGGKLVLHHPLDLGLFLQQIASEEVNYTVVPPALLNMLLMKPEILEQADLSSIKNIGSGSAPLSPWMVEQWQERFGIHIINMFGSNEGTALTSGPREFPAAADRAQYFPRFGISDYEWSSRIAAQMETKLVEPQTRRTVTEPGVAGELAIRSPGIFSGYYRRPDLTREVFDEDGFFYTGDLFEIAGEEPRLDRYRFVGRVKEIINRGGLKISPSELEGLLAGHPKVAEAAFLGYPDERLGEKVCAVVVPKQGSTISLEEIVEFLEEKEIAVYKLPEKLVIVEELPRNPVGKIMKRELRERLTT
jgi:acyl-CoA synthetase (AMP-forming)/AMP-acid ligase II